MYDERGLRAMLTDVTRPIGVDLSRVVSDGERRVRRRRLARITGGAGAAMVVVLAVVIGVVGVVHGRDGTRPTNGGPASPTAIPSPPGPAPSGSVSASPSTTGPSRTATAIPDTAFLRAADTYRGDPTDEPSDNMLPPLCGVSFPSDASITARRTVSAPYSATPPSADQIPTAVIVQTITVYATGGAEAFVSQLRAATLGCPTQQVDGQTRHNRILAAPKRGDGSLLIEARYPAINTGGELTGEDEFRLTSVVRDGDRVLVLTDTRWECCSSVPTAVDRLTAAALARMRAWHG
jgi:hypothetical protein